MSREVFIVRPFKKKKGIDFDEIDEKLIQPALRRVGWGGKTAQHLFKSGDIRYDLFEKLLMADLVIVDVSIHSANVFYELGVRHAFRKKHTILIRCDKHKIPFDINLLRYLEYDRKKPEASVSELVKAIESSLATGEDESETDSPAFMVLPRLSQPKISALHAIPGDFSERAGEAYRAKFAGDLTLFSEEIIGSKWEEEGHRVLGEYLFNLDALEQAVPVWKRVHSKSFNDVEALSRLSTLYQRLGMLEDSDRCLGLILGMKDLPSEQRAEALGLKGRNEKEKWINAWRSLPEVERYKSALRSSHLQQSYDFYREAFTIELKNYWTGQNALTLLIVQIELAEKEVSTWKSFYTSESQAEEALNTKRVEKERLKLIVDASLKSAEYRVDVRDKWELISRADLSLLTGNDAGETRRLYREARQRDDAFVFSSALRQVGILIELGIRAEHTAVALAELVPAQPKVKTRVILFTGHMIDAKEREPNEARFPADKESSVREAIREKVKSERQRILNRNEEEGCIQFLGISGGACGGDIIFHEVCEELGIETHMYIPFNRKDFFKSSVEFAGGEWINRFNQLFDKLQKKNKIVQLQKKEKMPAWLSHKKAYTVWERNNRWMLHHARAKGDAGVSLIALWDKMGQDGTGGTQDMVSEAASEGARIIEINPRELS